MIMKEKLYANIGKKIQGLALWCFMIEAAGAVVSGIYLLTEGFILYGLLSILLGPVVAWVSSWLLYAFGQLVDDVNATRDTMPFVRDLGQSIRALVSQQKTEHKPAPQNRTTTKNPAPERVVPNQEGEGFWICGKCKTKNLNTRNDCWSCGNKK